MNPLTSMTSMIGSLSSGVPIAFLAVGCLATVTHAQIAISGDVSPSTVTNPQWEVVELLVGNASDGTLNVGAGGRVLADLDVTLGFSATSTGTANVVGAGAYLASGDGLIVGRSGIGILNILNGGVVSDGQDSRSSRVGNGTVIVSGQGSLWSNASSSMAVGSSGEGSLTISDGGKVTSNELTTIGVGFGEGVARVTGPGSVWETTGEFIVGGSFGSGSLIVEEGGRVVGDLGFVSKGGNASVTVTGAGSTWANTGFLGISSNVRRRDVAMVVSQGGLVSNTDGFIGSSVDDAEVTVTDMGSIWRNSGDLTIGGMNPRPDSGTEGVGTLNIQNNGEVIVDGTVKLWSKGIINLDGGKLEANVLDLSEDGAALNLVSGTLDVGTLLGNFTQNGGSLAPGNSPGVTSIVGDYTLNNGSIEIELAGTTPVTQYDFVEINSGSAILNGGDLNVSFLAGFEDSILATDIFTVLTAEAGLSGIFTGLNDGATLQTVDGLGSFQVNYSGNSVVLSNFSRSVPEPSSAMILGCLATGALVRRRRHG